MHFSWVHQSQQISPGYHLLFVARGIALVSRWATFVLILLPNNKIICLYCHHQQHHQQHHHHHHHNNHVYIFRSTSGTVCLLTIQTTTARESSWTGSSIPPAVSAGLTSYSSSSSWWLSMVMNMMMADEDFLLVGTPFVLWLQFMLLLFCDDQYQYQYIFRCNKNPFLKQGWNQNQLAKWKLRESFAERCKTLLDVKSMKCHKPASHSCLWHPSLT